MEYKITEYKTYLPEEILPLYAAVGWTNCLDRPDMLRQAYANSLCTMAAFDGGKLIGIIRAVGDGYSVVFVQDLLVDPQYHRRGIGSMLLKAVIERFPDVYQMELITDDTTRSVRFYETNGFTNVADLGCLAYMKIQ